MRPTILFVILLVAFYFYSHGGGKKGLMYLFYNNLSRVGTAPPPLLTLCLSVLQ